MVEARRFADPRFTGWRSWWCRSLTAGLILTGLHAAALAQINPFQGYSGPTLSKQDLDMSQAATRKLLTDDRGEVGKSEHWVGATSGNQGDITVLKSFTRQGMPCRTLRSAVRYKQKSAPPRSFTLDVCRLQNGEWKIV
jgi:surface antigen